MNRTEACHTSITTSWRTSGRACEICPCPAENILRNDCSAGAGTLHHEDEIDHALDRGGGAEGGAGRIYEYFTADHRQGKGSFSKMSMAQEVKYLCCIWSKRQLYEDRCKRHYAEKSRLRQCGAELDEGWQRRLTALFRRTASLPPAGKERYAQSQREKEAERELPTQAQTD